MDLLDILGESFDMTDYCGQFYWRWEDRATKHLTSLGYTVYHWYSTEQDSFGPLGRAVKVLTPSGEKETLWYG